MTKGTNKAKYAEVEVEEYKCLQFSCNPENKVIARAPHTATYHEYTRETTYQKALNSPGEDNSCRKASRRGTWMLQGYKLSILIMQLLKYTEHRIAYK